MRAFRSSMHRTSLDLGAIAAEAGERAREVAQSSQAASINVDVLAGATEELIASFGGITQETERAHQFVDGVNASTPNEARIRRCG